MNALLPALLLTIQMGGGGAAGPHGPVRTVSVDGAASNAAVASLRSDLEHLLRVPGWHDVDWSVMVVSLDRGDTLFAHDAGLRQAPASNMKLFTTAAALYYLGPDFRYNTFLLGTGPVRDGVLEGDLVLYGTGDPTVSDRFDTKLSVWEAFADTLAALGVREVRGDIVGDASYFRGPGVGEGWEHSYINATYAAPASALTYAENIATLQILPAAKADWRPEVRLIPGGDGIAIVNEARTVKSGRTALEVFRETYDGPVIVRGRISLRSKGQLRWIPVADPGRYAAAALREVLSKRDIVVAGSVRSIRSADESPVTGRSIFAPTFDASQPVHVLAIHTSPPLIDILEIVNKKSHNLMAEQTLRTVGRITLGEGSARAGTHAVKHLLDVEAGVDTAQLSLIDGSGLSPLNRVTTRSIIHLLGYMADSPMWQSYWRTLPEAGARDGLHRMYRTAAEGNLKAKTGTIDHVSALSGYVTAANGEQLAFSIISNDVPSTWKAKRVEDAIGARLANFDRPVVAPSEPAAVPPAAASSAPVPQSRHEIRPGETLEEIAARYGTTVRALREENPDVDPRRLIPGTSLRLPRGTTAADTSAVETAARPARSREHVIRKGDTLDGIARRFDTTVDALREANPGIDPRRLIPGKRVRIPGG